MARISDVAARAGVSTATVSRALSGKASVDPELVERVRRAAADLDYRPNALARNLRRQETRVVALIVSDIENPFFTALARGVEDVARTAGYSVVLCNSDEDPDKEARYLEVAASERMAGVLISPTTEPAALATLAEHRIPAVAVDRPLSGDTTPGPVGADAATPPVLDTVVVDNRGAARAATEHLLASGYRRIGCLSGPTGIPTADDRVAGHRDALAAARAAGVVDADGPERRVDFRAEPARRAAIALLRGPDRPDALLVGNSAMAIGVLEALGHLGLRAGRAVGVVAFDDAAWATLVDPPLSVVVQPARQIGAVAAEALLNRVLDPARPATRTVLGAHLVARGSSSRS